MKEVIVIGGGIIGLSTAYYLQKEGYSVTVIDQSSMDSGASYVNAGYISPSHFIPLASPGVVRQGLKWMFNSASPLYMKPRADWEFLDWVWAFTKSCSPRNVAKSVIPLKEIALLSQGLFAEIKKENGFNFHMEEKGLLVLCNTPEHFEKEQKLVEQAQRLEMVAQSLSKSELQVLEPELELDVIGGSLYQCDWHSTPGEFMDEMKKYLLSNGVAIYKEESIMDLKFQNGRIQQLIGKTRTFEAHEFVLAAGTWSYLLAKKIGLRLKLQAGKGYRIDSHWDTKIQMPAILAESRVAVTPMRGFTRFAGTMEIAGINYNVRKERVQAIANAVTSYYPTLFLQQKELEEARCGLRPLSADGRPYIGKSAQCKNLTIATGHAMMGWSMGPATGKLVSEVISGNPTSIDIIPFHPDRRF